MQPFQLSGWLHRNSSRFRPGGPARPRASVGFSPHKAARPDWLTDARERAIADIIVAAEQVGDLNYYELMSLEADTRVLGSLGAYVNGDIDLDTALNQIDAVVVSPVTP